MKTLPKKIGGGGSYVREPSHQELSDFLELLAQVPYTYFGRHQPCSADYGTEYTSVIIVKDWLELIKTAKLLKDDAEVVDTCPY